MFKDAQRIRIGHHHCSNIGTFLFYESLQVFYIYQTFCIALYLYNLQTTDGSRSRISAMCRIGDNHLGTLMVATALMIGTDDHQPRQFTMRTSTRIERKLTKSRQFSQRLL